MKIGGFDSYEIVETHPGSFFENMLADHPFLPKTSRLVLADYVTMDSGTGCVHTAPGFGADDYVTCKRYGMDMVVPVDDQGKHTAYAGKYEGMTTDASNPVILQDMKDNGTLFASEDIVHSYPPLLALQAAHHLPCHPPVVLLRGQLQGRGHRRLRGRALGARLGQGPYALHDPGAHRLVHQPPAPLGPADPRVLLQGLRQARLHPREHRGRGTAVREGGLQRLVRQRRRRHSAQGLHLPPTAARLLGFDKETDTLDGWFDSGSTHFAAMERDQGFWPATMYIEGLDQYRGWFQSSLLVAVGALGRGAPFKECVTHGWTVDGEGKAMHKSLGNGMDPAEIFNKYGADLLRLWAGSSDYHVDVRCSDEIFKQLSQNYLKFRNTAKFCLDNLVGFDADHLVEPGEMLPLDKWAITRLNDLLTKAYAAYDNYEFHVVSHMINDFCVVDLSSFYFDILKDRLYCDEAEGLSRRSAQTALFLILDAMTRLFAPILAFTCDEIWLAMPHRSCDDARNVLFNEMVLPYNGYALSEDEMARWARIAALRTAVNGALETARADKTIGKSLEAEVDLTVTPEDGFLASMDAAQVADLFIVSQVRVDVDAEQEGGRSPRQRCQVCPLLEGPAHRGQRQRAPRPVPPLRRRGQKAPRHRVKDK